MATETTGSGGGAALARRLLGGWKALIVPALLLLAWHLAIAAGMSRLIPSPAEVARYMVDFAVGGI